MASPTEPPTKQASNVDIAPRESGSSSSSHLKGQGNTKPGTKWSRFRDSFRKMEELDPLANKDMTDLEKAVAATSNAHLSRSLKTRHLQMIAIGGAIGTGLFVGSGSALRTGGPAALLIGWILVGTMIYCTLAVTFPVSGAFAAYSTRFLDPSWGFAMGSLYALNWLIILPLELVAASITVSYWKSDVNNAAWVSIFYVLILAINMFGVKGYGEAEFVFSIIKVIAVIGFIFLGIILNCGGGPQGGYIGGTFWRDPGAFANGFKGVCSVFVTAAFAFTGTEMVGLAAAESENPRKSLPKATKQVFWRITLFYIVSLTLVGLLVRYDDDRLIGTSSVDASASPFVIAINNGGIKGLPSVMNVVILIAVLSVGNSAVYGCSRTLASLAAQGLLPHFLAYIDRKGRPLAGIAMSALFGLLCFVSASDKQGEVFAWLMALVGLSSCFTWGSICLCHIRFRQALTFYGRDTSELAFTSQATVYGSWWGFIMNILIMIAQFWIALFPLHDNPDPAVFFKNYLAFPIVIAMYVGHKIYLKNWIMYVKLPQIDIDSGRRDLDLDKVKQELAEERLELALKPFYYRVYKFWC
ncbi:hypothetical protein BABINDRAFT_31195 [Babjeviella inositovora NRRL Y-12698]|uniref:Amino acid permease/ SLC12A domain-containing protein n=1 Tax=Babjeviella inositovora NRRL Y-12698 TaxID=984486 RepID=A0A1E3QZM7_9ASCO|nr:uncharacterized protein BABINDRAFT_31195 [Babjeviella inositovora NRRL Y-12698]ODQ83130.1 hypothetical protein BABINDRAFT_31195 [Babjeviella inositovora NRRL Y-12698]